MSRPHQVADAERLVRTLTRELAKEIRTPANCLSALEQRILAIARYLFTDCVIVARANSIERTGEPIDRVPITPVIAAEGARIAITAAIELEAPLREIRERVEGGR